jgi:endonuclease/exonuclease/phosphatase family metal-dependent hydrolase
MYRPLAAAIRAAALLAGTLILCSGCGSGLKVRTLDLADQPPPPPMAMGKRVLRIAAYNLSHGRGNQSDNDAGGDERGRVERLERIAGFVRERNIDILVLNEVDFDAKWSHRLNQAGIIAAEAGYTYRVEQTNLVRRNRKRRFGNAVLSRLPIVHARRVEFPSYGLRQTLEDKQGMVCTVELPDGSRVLVAAIDLDRRERNLRVDAAIQLDAIRVAYSDTPVVAAGTFHSAPNGFPHVEPGVGGSALDFLLRHKGFHTLPTTEPTLSDFTFPAAKPDRVIDWVLVPTDWDIISKDVYQMQLSQHLPVVMTVRLPAGR